MPRFLFQATYESAGVEGVRSGGGSSRRDAIAETAKSLGGSLETFDFAFGEYDVYTIIDLPDAAAAAAVALSVNATGVVKVNTTVLLTAEQLDDAAKRSVTYRPPGG